MTSTSSPSSVPSHNQHHQHGNKGSSSISLVAGDPMAHLLAEMTRIKILFRSDSASAAMCIRNGISPRDLFRPFVREIPRIIEARSINDSHVRISKISLKLQVLEEFEAISPKVHSELSDLAQLVARHCPGPSF